MKSLISLAVMLFIGLSVFASVDAMAKSCGCKAHHHKHSQHSEKYYRRVVAEGYCEARYDCKCGRYYVCHPTTYMFCRTEVSYHHGKNSGKLEVCY